MREQSRPHAAGQGGQACAEVNRRLAALVSALGVGYPAPGPGADPLVGARMPDIALSIAGSTASRVYELLHEGRFVLLNLAQEQDFAVAGKAGGDGGRSDRVSAVTTTGRPGHAALDGVAEVLVRPDGHIAWATRTADAAARRTQRHHALSAWAGKP
ncbi:hypothetical protein [Streptomyces sp. NPDC002209]|uniref:aromatic-ring hydroxylase C-terminal domain-containing protein n=1 Tax=Streptomyces sp. NPDC002209 TaxID=3364638 RepID=UPI00368D55F9